MWCHCLFLLRLLHCRHLSFLQFTSEHSKNAEENAATEGVISQTLISRSCPGDDCEYGSFYQDEGSVSEGFGNDFQCSHYLSPTCLYVCPWALGGVSRSNTLQLHRQTDTNTQTNAHTVDRFWRTISPFASSWHIKRYASSLETRSLSVERAAARARTFW